jgi:hypothetical protein
LFGHRFFDRAKDGGPESTVTGYWLCEIKGWFSIALLKFEDGSRDTYHSHAFKSWNWVLRGRVLEQHLRGGHEIHGPGLRPVVTRRGTFHRVVSVGTTWVFSIRGPWAETWEEFDPETSEFTTLTHGRAVVS